MTTKHFAYRVIILNGSHSTNDMLPPISEDKELEACFIALQQVIARRPLDLFNLRDDETLYYQDANQRTFAISLQP